MMGQGHWRTHFPNSVTGDPNPLAPSTHRLMELPRAGPMPPAWGSDPPAQLAHCSPLHDFLHAQLVPHSSGQRWVLPALDIPVPPWCPAQSHRKGAVSLGDCCKTTPQPEGPGGGDTRLPAGGWTVTQGLQSVLKVRAGELHTTLTDLLLAESMGLPHRSLLGCIF